MYILFFILGYFIVNINKTLLLKSIILTLLKVIFSIKMIIRIEQMFNLCMSK